MYVLWLIYSDFILAEVLIFPVINWESSLLSLILKALSLSGCSRSFLVPLLLVLSRRKYGS